jgi:hypothetical protein
MVTMRLLQAKRSKIDLLLLKRTNKSIIIVIMDQRLQGTNYCIILLIESYIFEQSIDN